MFQIYRVNSYSTTVLYIRMNPHWFGVCILNSFVKCDHWKVDCYGDGIFVSIAH